MNKPYHHYHHLISIQANSLEYLAYFLPVLMRCFLIASFNLTHSILPFMYMVKVVIPSLDLFLPLDRRNKSKEEQEELEKDWKFTVPLYLGAGVEIYFNLWLLNVIYFVLPALSYYQLVFFILVIGTSSGGNILLGHELTHRKGLLNQMLGHFCYLRVLYTNFGINHNQGHHKWVGTPHDPTSARQGQDVYSFAIQSIRGSFWQAWRIQQKRLQKKGFSEIGQFLRNRVLHCKLAEFVYLLAIYQIWGLRVAAHWVLIGLMLQFSLEVVNYIEHYGLRRKEVAPGKYERVSNMHSWNTADSLNNFLVYKFTRHSDHHENAARPYQALQLMDSSPELPLGYDLSLNIALKPKLWFAMIDPLVNAYQKQERPPSEDEIANCIAIGRQVTKKKLIQVHALCLLGLIL